uniref:Uncharacterized protein n=1 Tax=Anopheles epiroticus TaxID=199890 RepID=A0A182PP83_9DIPT
MSKTPTKAELKAEIQKILKDANLEETAAKKVRLQLEKNLKCDLSNRKKEVDELVMDYVNSQASSDGEEDEDEDEDDDEYAGNGKGKLNSSKPKGNSDYEDEEEEEDDDDEDEDFSEEEKPKGRKSAGKRTTPAKRGPAKKKKRTSDSEDEESDEEEQGSDDDYNPRGSGKGSKGGKKKRNDSDSDSDGDWKQSKPAKGKKSAGGGAKRSSGYTRPYKLSPDLAELCGAESLPRHEVVRKVWAIIKERNLYDPKNRQFAICDDQLKKVIGTKRFRTFGMLKYLKPHFIQ